MKKFSVFLSICLLFGMVSQVSALSFGDEYFVGIITPGGGSVDSEVAQVNYLIGLGLGETDTFDGDDYLRSDNDFGTMPSIDPADVDDGDKQDNDTITFDATGYEYIIGKYDHDSAGVAVWYNAYGFDGIVTLPGTWMGLVDEQALSHTVGMDAVNNPVPEPATMLLLGTGLVGLAGISRKKFNK